MRNRQSVGFVAATIATMLTRRGSGYSGQAVATAAGKMIFRLLAVFAEFESDLVSERTTAALQHKKSNGQRTGSVPYGFDLGDDGKTLLENETEQAVIRDIRAMRTESGYTLKRIAGTLTERAVPTKTGKSSRWTHQAVQRILKRTVQ